MVCERCEMLAMELALARDKLGEISGANDHAALKRWLGLSRVKARVMLRMYRSPGRYLPDWLLAEELVKGEDAEPGTIKVIVHQLRKLLGQDAIETSPSYGGGYRIGAAAAVRMREALEAGA